MDATFAVRDCFMSAALAAIATPKSSAEICPACGAPSATASRVWRFVNARGETNWLQCHSCHSYFMDRDYQLATEVEHTRTMTWGDTEQGAQLNQFKQRMYRSILKQIRRYQPPEGRRLLDVGCAYGGFMTAARAEGFDVLGYDIVPEAVEHVRKSGFPAQVCSRIQDFSLSTEPLDVITVLDANIYWPDQPAELSEIFNRLRPGGLLVMRIVDKSWMARIGALLRQVSPAQGERILRRAVNDHRFSMPATSFLSVLQKVGFRVISASPRGAVHSDHTSMPVKLSFGLGIALWHTLGIFLAPGAVVIAERPE
jgi:2-polyprenyl-3-methyl-5-hydroxy-6-metoxy-1,4-benzoquinol methylase